MKNNSPIKISSACRIMLAVWFMLATATAVRAQFVTKVVDLLAGQDAYGNGVGPNVPECRLTQVGSNLWFTCNLGGALGAGGVFSLDPSSNLVTQLATLDGNTGNKPWAASIVVADGKGWFTTSAGGVGAKGSLCSIDLTNYTVSNVFSFPSSGLSGSAPHSTPVQIGEELWFTTSAGGTVGSTYGAIVKYNLTNNTLTNVFSLDQTNYGRQPLGSSLVQVSNAYYLLTFAGGTNTSGGTPNGAGALDKLTFDGSGAPTLAKVADLPGHFLSFPAGDPVYDGTNYLYFTSAGVSTNPGAVGRYDIAAGVVTALFNFVTNSASVTNFGTQPYGTPVLYNNELYFTTLAGGTVGKGVLDKLTLSNNVVTKLADFETTTNLALGGSPQYGGGTLYTNPVSGAPGIYFPINKGGVYNFGTIVRVGWYAPPIVATITNSPGGLVISWAGGYKPFNVDFRTNFTDAWQTGWLGGLFTNSITLPATNGQAFFRISGVSQ